MDTKEGQSSSSIAWFKLATLIEKKEKEKALNVLRLMTHSLRDKAYSLQLEGDILWSLDEYTLAHEKYTHSALLYQKDKRWIHAVSLYENLLSNNPTDLTTIISSVLCYGKLGWENKFKEKLDKIGEIVLKNPQNEHLLTSAFKALFDISKELENDGLKAAVNSKVQAVFSGMPNNLAEKIEYSFKNN